MIGLYVVLFIAVAFAVIWKLATYGRKDTPNQTNLNLNQTQKNNLKGLDQVPGPTQFDPSLGNIPDLAKAGSLHEYLTLLHSQYGPVAGFRYFNDFVISLASPEVFKQTNKLINRPVPLFSLFKQLIGERSLQYANDDDAKNRRKLLDPFFTSASTKKIFPVFLEATRKCVSKWESNMTHTNSPCVINLHKDMFEIAIYAIALAAFGSEMPKSDTDLLRDSYEHCWGEMEASLKGSPIEPGTPREAIFFQKRDLMFNLVQKMVDSRRSGEEGEDGNTNKGVGGLIEFMLQHKSFSHEQIQADTVTFLVGGFHTTANFLIWTVYFLAKYPQYQRKVREEITELLGEKEPTFEVVSGMPYTTAVLNESLRLAALAPFAGRYSNEDESIGGFLVPKGTMMIQALGVVLQDKKYWDSPETFNPSRFLSQDDKSEVPSAQWAFRPFGVGNRMCPASKYAMIEAKAVVVLLLQRYQFELLEGQKEVTAEYGLVGQVREELHLRVVPIKH